METGGLRKLPQLNYGTLPPAQDFVTGRKLFQIVLWKNRAGTTSLYPLPTVRAHCTCTQHQSALLYYSWLKCEQKAISRLLRSFVEKR